VGVTKDAPSGEALKTLRLDKLPPYLFVELDRAKERAKSRGLEVIDLGVGDPDIETNPRIVRRLAAAAAVHRNQVYPSGRGSAELRAGIAQWFQKRFGVSVDPDTEVLVLIGSKEGLFHLPLAVANSGETVLVPDPAYPVYQSAAVFADAVIQRMPLLSQNGFLPDLEKIFRPGRPSAGRASLMYLNYPNNPTSSVATREFFTEAVSQGRRMDLIVANDAAYSEIYLEDAPSPSILEAEGATDTAIEFHSFSKTYCMTGFRVAFAVGCPRAISALQRVKDNLDSGVFGAVQEAALEALEIYDEEKQRVVEVYRRRRDLFTQGLRRLGLSFEVPAATFYVWCELPAMERDSIDFSRRLLEETGVVAAPGRAFGEYGEGYIRFSLTSNSSELADAIDRLGGFL
jgi:LL-diaminopimelate aminotransferase